MAASGPALSGSIPLTYSLADPSSTPTDIVPEFTLDGSHWFLCTEGLGGDGTQGLTTSPQGVVHTYVWDSLTDLGPIATTVVVAICPTGQPASISAPFSVDDTNVAPPSSPTTVVRDWTKAPVVVVASASEVLAVGDVHGDYQVLVQLLVAAHVIAGVPSQPSAVQWSAGTALLVCTGDLIDKYTDSLDVIALFRALEPAAAAAGGQVIVLMGNHEAEFLAGSGVAPQAVDFETELTNAGLSPSDVAAGTDALGIGAWLRARPIAAKIGDWFFCHAGNTGGQSVDQLTSAIESDVDAHGFAGTTLIGGDSILEARLHPAPWWEGLVQHAKNQTQSAADEAELASYVAAVGASHLVIGHQPEAVTFSDKSRRKQDALFTNFDGLLFLIDTGMSRGVDGGLGGVLDITGIGTAQAAATGHMADGTTVALWQ